MSKEKIYKDAAVAQDKVYCSMATNEIMRLSSLRMRDAVNALKGSINGLEKALKKAKKKGKANGKK